MPEILNAPATELVIYFIISALVGALIAGLIQPPMTRFSNHMTDVLVGKFGSKNMDDEELQKETERLYQDIMSFYRERKRAEPPIETSWDDRDRYIDRSRNHTADTIGMYRERFGPRVQKILNEYRKGDIDVSDVEQRHKRPTNPLGIEEIANELLSLTEKLYK